jgi:hypothetical protein
MSKYYLDLIVNTLIDVNKLLGQKQAAIDYLYSTPGFDWNEFYLYLAYQGLQGTPEYTEYRKTRSGDFLNKYKYKGQANSTKLPKCD